MHRRLAKAKRIGPNEALSTSVGFARLRSVDRCPRPGTRDRLELAVLSRPQQIDFAPKATLPILDTGRSKG